MPSETELSDAVLVPWLIAVATMLCGFAVQIAVALVILLRRRRTSAVRLAWLIVVFAFPIVGVLAYLLFGEVRLGRRREERHQKILERVSASVQPQASVEEPVEGSLHKHQVRFTLLAEKVGGTPARPGNSLRLFGDGTAPIGALVEDIDRSERSCHLLFYIYLDDDSGTRVGEALARAAQRGVACRLLVDSVGSGRFLKSRLCREMRQAGVQIAEALPVGPVRALFRRVDVRNHRKIAVLDGAVGWTGSRNIADPSFAIKAKFAPWVDVMVRLEGPAVYDLQVLFIGDWLLDADERFDELITPRPAARPDGVVVHILGTGPNANNTALRQLARVGCQEVRREQILTTPYFAPDDATAAAIYTAPLRGVRTLLIVPARNDSPLVHAASRSLYEPILDTGGEIYEYQRGLLHAKTMTFDGETAVVTTANLDRRSFELNFEVTLIVYDAAFTEELRALQLSYLSDSVAVDVAAWHERSWQERLWQNTAGILTPLL